MTSSGWMLTEWIGLNSIVCTCIASICSEYFYTYTIYTLECIYLFCKLIYFKYTYTLMHLFASICSSQRDSMHSVLIYASSGQLQIPQIHTFTLMGELWGIIYTYTLMGNHIQLCTYTLVHLYTYAASYTMQQIETSTQPCAMDIVHVIHACATTRYHRFALMELLCMCWSKYPGANIGDTCASTDSHREACRATN